MPAPLFASRRSELGALAVWLILVCVGVCFHEYWRDEVRALSIAVDASSLQELFLNLNDEGHPATWYVALRLASNVLPYPTALPLLSVAAATGAAMTLTRLAPLPWHVTILFLFGAPLLYEYSVMARSYGMGTFLMFASTALISAKRQRPLVFAATIAVLINTSAHFAILGALLTAISIRPILLDHTVRRSHLLLAGTIVAAGFLLALSTIIPSGANLVAQPRALTLGAVVASALTNAISPMHTFWKLTYPLETLGWPLLWFVILGLAARPTLLAATIVAIAGIGALSDLIYIASYRHQAILVVWLLSMYWYAVSPHTTPVQGARARMLRLSVVFGLPLLLLPLVAHGAIKLWRDIQAPMSASRAAATIIRERYPNAIVIAEPDFIAESLPYYVDQPIYIPREARYGRTVRFTSASQATLTMHELLNTADTLGHQTARPVILLIGHALPASPAPGEAKYPYNKHFEWTADDLVRLSSRTVQIMPDPGAEIESYSAFALQSARVP